VIRVLTSLSQGQDDIDEGGTFGPMIDPADDDGYISPEFDLPLDEDDEDETPRPPKRAKSSKAALAEEEELALQLLRGTR
jgi:ATP-dependent RNA helicase DDX10/DBP4